MVTCFNELATLLYLGFGFTSTYLAGGNFSVSHANSPIYTNVFVVDTRFTSNRIVVMFLDQAEFRAQRRQDIKMRDWEMSLDKFLRDTELPVLPDAGSVGREDALAWANGQYDAFAEGRRLEAEASGDALYLDDLRTSAQVLETERKKLNAPAKSGKKRPKRGGAAT